MALELPKPGQVIGYRYLWWSEYRRGHEEGVKERPCAVVYAVKNLGNTTRVYVLPVTHAKPLNTEDGIELLPQWKQHLGLDSQPSWVVTSELNHFEWPGVDIRGTSTEAISYGFLPHKVTTRLREMIRERVAKKSLSGIDRDLNTTKAVDSKHEAPKPTEG
jgi:hypothetical protein